MDTEYKPKLQEFESDEEINAAIYEFVHETNEFIHYLKISRDRDGWKERLKKKRDIVLQIFRKAQDFIYICMKDKKASVPYRIVDILNLLWRLRNIGEDYDEYSNMACKLIVGYENAPILEELRNI